MAKQTADIDAQYRALEKEILSGDIKPFYLLFGKEHYYIDKICNLLMENVLAPHERDFAQIVYFGADVTSPQIVSAARQYPMMASRQLVVVKEAQMVKKIEDVGWYFSNVVPSTVLVICYKTPTDNMSTKNVDKRTKFYKDASKVGVVFESNPVPDYKMTGWIENLIKSDGYSIEPEASALLAEYCGTDLNKVVLEFDKLKRSISGTGKKSISSGDVEENVGMSREFSVFELTKALSNKNAPECYKIAAFFGESIKRFPLPIIMGALTNHFLRLLKYHAAVSQGLGSSETASAIGVNPYFLRDYQTAARNYPQKKTMAAISVLKEYDYRSKSNARGNASDAELLIELISRLLNI